VKHYLEGFEKKKHSGKKAFFVAVPTTAGTGSELTKNAVLSEIGGKGFKKSLRHENFVPDISLIDPALTISCPFNVSVSSGFDAFVQLLESFVSTKSNIITDALSLEGIKLFSEAFPLLCKGQLNDIVIRTKMSLSAAISGIVLSNAGLGIVHGIASVMGGFFEIPHGVICANLSVEEIKANTEMLKVTPDSDRYLEKYAKAGSFFSANNHSRHFEKDIDILIKTLEDLLETTKVPRFSDFSIKENDLVKISKEVSNKNNPVKLNEMQLFHMMKKRL